jgi:putative FmdB family regulatory protein
MPIYEYRASDEAKCCEHCKTIFEVIHKFGEQALQTCPKCNNSVKRIMSRVGISYGLDFKAKGTGLHKLVRRDKGTYEKMY